MSYDTNMTLVAAVLVVGLVVGAGVGFYMTPTDTGADNYSSTLSYDTGYEKGYEDAKREYQGRSYSSSSSDDEGVAGLTTLVYGSIGASLVAALASIVSLMQTSRNIHG